MAAWQDEKFRISEEELRIKLLTQDIVNLRQSDALCNNVKNRFRTDEHGDWWREKAEKFLKGEASYADASNILKTLQSETQLYHMQHDEGM